MILLATLNARFAHTSLGLRYLRANMGELRERTLLAEFVIGAKTEMVVERILDAQPRIVGLGVYIWNVVECTRIVAMLKTLRPDIVVVVGGPEVSFEVGEQRICALADFVVTGWGDVTFAGLCRQILHGPRPLMKVHAGEQPALDQITLPYAEYTDRDIAQRHLYVEASRGCPFKCEFCLSALDQTAWPFALEPFIAELDALHRRGARRFKFVDRTFNLNPRTGARILEFFLQRIEAAPEDPCYAHFELIPDHLPEALKALIARFPAGTLQFEIGIQSFNPEVQQRLSRKQDNARAASNIRWLATHSHAHLHVDLIAGLPGESLASFAAGFDRLYALGPHEIQFGILKRLRGTPIARHTEAHAMRYNPEPPYNILANDQLDFPTLQRLSRFARYWDLIANSGRFPHSLPLLLAGGADNSAFGSFLRCADWLYARTGQTHQLALERLFDLLRLHLVEERGIAPPLAQAALEEDYRLSGARGRPKAGAENSDFFPAALPRQARHLAA
jgi:radical SAM superfamily enzyme YgiQ (UPF0313 family)